VLEVAGTIRKPYNDDNTLHSVFIRILLPLTRPWPQTFPMERE
jgi:hypothetical protein